MSDPRLVACDECDGLVDVQTCFVMCPSCTKKDSDDNETLRAEVERMTKVGRQCGERADEWAEKYRQSQAALAEAQRLNKELAEKLRKCGETGV